MEQDQLGQAAKKEITQLTNQLRAVEDEIARLTALNKQLTEQNAELEREKLSLQEQLYEATQGRADGEERLRMLQGMINDLIKKRICSLLGEVIIAIAVKRIDINTEMDEPSIDRFLGDRLRVTWKKLLVSLMKYAEKHGYNIDSVLGLYGGQIIF